MEAKPADRRKGWVPQPRPEWVSRVNEEGSHMDLHSVVPLDENSLIASAKANTGLSDFGSDDWHEPFQVLVKSLDTESGLNLIGRLMARTDLLMFLEGRLWIEEVYKKHPEIDNEQIVAPLLIMGQGRCGTTWMHNLLAADPTNRVPMTWEALLPYPPPEKATFKTDPRIEIARNRVGLWNRVTPEFASMHDMAGDIPTENIHIQCLSFQSPVWFNMFGMVPSYNAFMQKRGLSIAYAYEKRVLKYLQWKNPGQRWVQKCPVYVNTMPLALEAFPDARFIWMHRDPVKALSSAVNVAGTLFWARSDHAFSSNAADGLLGNIESYVSAEVMSASMNRAIDWIESGLVPKEQFYSIHYADLVKDPLQTVRKLYKYFSIEVPPNSFAALQARVDEANRHRQQNPPHKYEIGPAEQVAKEREFYRRYQTYFSVANEV